MATRRTPRKAKPASVSIKSAELEHIKAVFQKHGITEPNMAVLTPGTDVTYTDMFIAMGRLVSTLDSENVKNDLRITALEVARNNQRIAKDLSDAKHEGAIEALRALGRDQSPNPFHDGLPHMYYTSRRGG